MNLMAFSVNFVPHACRLEGSLSMEKARMAGWLKLRRDVEVWVTIWLAGCKQL